MRVAFAGTPEFAVPALAALLQAELRPLVVLTQPDRPAGRGRQLQPSPVKQLAQIQGLPVWQPETLKDAELQRQLAELQLDLMVVVAYGLLLPRKVLALPRHGCWNLHASLLPRWRGAAPIQRAIEAGDSETGICLMQMEVGLDTGPVLLSKSLSIAADETAGSLHDRLSQLGAEVLGEGLRRLQSGQLPSPQTQPEEGVSYARKLEKTEAQLDWQAPARALYNKIRAFSPWPVAECVLAGERLRVHAAELVESVSGTPGEVVQAGQGRLLVACAEGGLALTRVQREGGRVIAVADYLNARRDLVGGA
ncbi:methionyl-tRNA formyltransferase [Pseudomarimonas arenosa]|uniref:Methionyl-tRNA formyltransferase n=1 Tax=Pseudomarimonas arenosa TaxID=2774145 RepID=A0AAW3ZGR2_9GAMM|nr:methionyl-tRNA formyltransferase [Pseudomarimonas arenosa]MBD8525211.1 methionyl-tRNA formyltransferase [Pseudomarimonas arenosa]